MRIISTSICEIFLEEQDLSLENLLKNTMFSKWIDQKQAKILLPFRYFKILPPELVEQIYGSSFVIIHYKYKIKEKLNESIMVGDNEGIKYIPKTKDRAIPRRPLTPTSIRGLKFDVHIPNDENPYFIEAGTMPKNPKYTYQYTIDPSTTKVEKHFNTEEPDPDPFGEE